MDTAGLGVETLGRPAVSHRVVGAIDLLNQFLLKEITVREFFQRSDYLSDEELEKLAALMRSAAVARRVKILQVLTPGAAGRVLAIIRKRIFLNIRPGGQGELAEL